MKSKYLNIKSFHSALLIMIALLMNVSLSFAQSGNMTKIKDGSVTGTTSTTAAPFSVLELESATKGFLLPRMTTAERNILTAKITDKERGRGLTIYNTDDDCINYWSTEKSKWLSLCGELPPAKISVDCGKIQLNASGALELKQGVSLKDTDVLFMSVNVLESGSYTISAVTTNGYSFNKTGVFETTGVYTIALEGFGTPLMENESPGDAVTFRVNGKENTGCNTTKIPVKSSEIDYKITTPAITLNWKAYKGVPLNATDNKIELEADVTTPGFWRITEVTAANGISFSGSGEFKTAGPNQKITIYGQGVPGAVGTNTFNFKTNSKNNKTPGVTATVQTIAAAFELVCDNPSKPIEYKGEFREDSKLTKSNAFSLPVKVIAPGLVDIELHGKFAGSTGTVVFKAPQTMLSFNGTDNIQIVTLYPEDKVIPLKTTGITFESMIPATTLCTTFPTIPIKERSKTYTFNCGKSYAFSGALNSTVFTTDTPLVAGTHGILVQVNVGYADTYTIKTNTLAGVYYEKSGTFTDGDRAQGTATVILEPKGVGVYTVPATHMYTLSTEGLGTGNDITSACSIPVYVKGRDINVLAIGTAYYAPSGKTNAYAPNAILQNPALFGPNGKVKVNSINIFTNKYINKFPDNLANYLAVNKIDIIIFAYNGQYGATERTALVDFVRNKKGVLIMADELNLRQSVPGSIYTDSSNLLIEALGNDSRISVYTGVSNGFTQVNKIIGPPNDPIIKTVEFGDLNGKYIGNDYAANGWYVTGLHSDYIPLAVSNSQSDKIAMFRHKDLGFIFMGDGGIFSGSIGNTSKSIWPVKYDSAGNLYGKDYLDRGTTYTVYNSILYANILKWAIDYVVQNKPAQ